MGRRRRRRRRRAPAPPPPPPPPAPAPAPAPSGQSTPPQTAQVGSTTKTQASGRVRMDPLNISKGAQQRTIAPTTVTLTGEKLDQAIEIFGGIDKEYGAFEKPPLDKVPGLDADVTWGHEDLPAVLVDWSEYTEQDAKDRVQYYKILEWVPGKGGETAPRSQTLKPLEFWNKYVETSDERDKDKKKPRTINPPKFRFSKWNNVNHGGPYCEGRIHRGRNEKLENYQARVKIARAAGKHRREMERKGYYYSHKDHTYKKSYKTSRSRYIDNVWKNSILNPANMRGAIKHKKKNSSRRRRRRRRWGSFFRRRRR
tara:strand:- start:1415 stop:2350 length:936 start_codon:yes stop_codon:yes gene_type:complete